MFASRRGTGAGGIEGRERGSAHLSPHRYVVIASPESMAWPAAFEARADVLVLDPLNSEDADVIGRLQPPGVGPEGTAVPRWAVYDCAEVSGAVIGILRVPITSPFDRPLDPQSFVLATPHAEPGAWHLYGLTVTGPGEGADEVRTQTIRIAMELLRADRVTLIVAWNSTLLGRLTKLGQVEVLAARTLLHGPGPAATVMLSNGTIESSRPSIRVGPAEDGVQATVARLQAALEEGRRFIVMPFDENVLEEGGGLVIGEL